MKRQVFEKPLALHLRYGSLDHIRAYEAITLTALQKKADQRQATAGTLTECQGHAHHDQLGRQLLPETDTVPSSAAVANASSSDVG